MPKVSKESTAYQDHGPVEEWADEFDGYAVDIVHFKEEMDSAPLLKGLPGDRCPCPHWGYVFKGRVTFAFENHEEVFEAGDAFYVPGGHRQSAAADTEYLEFSPADQLREVSETIQRNLEAMQGG